MPCLMPASMPRAPTVPKKCSGRRHVAEQEADGEQIEEDAEGAGDAVVGFCCRAVAGLEMGISQMLAPYQEARAGMKRCISP